MEGTLEHRGGMGNLMAPDAWAAVEPRLAGM